MEMGVVNFEIFLIAFSIFILLLFITTFSLYLWAIIECVITEKDRTKLMFWILVIFGLGSIGSLLYLIYRRPRRRREKRDPNFSTDIEERILSIFNKIKVPDQPLPQGKKLDRKAARVRVKTMTILAFSILALLTVFLIIFLVQYIPDSTHQDSEPPIILIMWIFLWLFLLLADVLVLNFFDPRKGCNELYLIGQKRDNVLERLYGSGYEETENDLFKPIIHKYGIHLRISDIDPEWDLPDEIREVLDAGKETIFVQAYSCGKKVGPSYKVLERFPFMIGEYWRKAPPQLMEDLRSLGADRILDATFLNVREIEP